MSATRIGFPGGPEVRLLDARAARLDENGLRSEARAACAAVGAPHVARSYRYPYCLVAWHTEPVGIDIERVEPCDRAFMELICTPAERAFAEPADDRDRLLASLWCGKEAVTKALGDPLSYEPSRVESPLVWNGQRAGRWRAVQLEDVPPGHVAWLCWADAAKT